MAFDAFVSYSSNDKTIADAACAMLESAGVRCWIAPRDIRPGREYGAAIIDAIDQCRVMVLIFSSSANDSGQIHREIERAVSKGVPIVPVRIEDVTPTRSMEYFLGAIHWLDALTPPLERHLRQLTETVNAILLADDAAHTTTADAAMGQAAAQRPDRNTGRFASRDAARPPTARADGSIAKSRARKRWLLTALGGGIGVALLAVGAWLYQSRPFGTCDIGGQWRMTAPFGQSTWTFSPLGNNRYGAQEQGLGNATGSGTVNGYSVRYEWRAGTWSGLNRFTLDYGCASGTGHVEFYTGGSGIQPARWDRIGAPPASAGG